MIVQCYRGKLKEGATSPLSSLEMYGRYAKEQQFTIILPALTIPGRVDQVAGYKNKPKLNSKIVEAKTKIASLSAIKADADKVTADKALLVENMQKEIAETQRNVDDAQLAMVGDHDYVEKNKLTPLTTTVAMAKFKAKEEKLNKATEKVTKWEEDIKNKKMQIEPLVSDFKKAQKKSIANENLIKAEQEVVNSYPIEYEATPLNYLTVFKYEDDGRILNMKSSSFFESNICTALTWYAIEKDRNEIVLINTSSEDISIKDGSYLEVTLIIGS